MHWWLSVLPYRVIGPDGAILFQAPEDLRYSPGIEQTMLETGCTIIINGKKLTQKELWKRGGKKAL